MQRHRYRYTPAACFVLLLLLACASSPISVAETAEQKAFALYGTFVTFQAAALQVVTDPATPQSVKRKIADAEARAKPVADNMLESARALMVIKAELAAGETTEDKLETATARLGVWVNQMVPLINGLIAALEGG